MCFLFGGTPFDGYDRGGRRSLNSGGGGGGGTQQTTSYQTNIPEYLRGPAEAMVARGQTLSEQPYQPYTGERIAGFSPMQTQAFTELGSLGPQQQFGQAGQAISGAQEFGAVGALNAMGYRPTQYNMYQMAQPGMFGSAQATQYMSPYQQAVTDVAKREALSEAQLLNRDLAGKAAKAGAFGGSRFGVEQALLGSKLAQNLSDIQVKGSQAAFENAQQQFERDRAAQMSASGQNLQAALTVQQQQDAARQAAAKLGLEGAQFGAQTGLQSAAQLGQLGTAEQEANLKRISAQQAAGAQQQALEQQRLDSAYQQAMEMRDWEKNQLGWLSGLIRGTPFSTSQLQTTSAPSASTASQLASLGLGAYGLSSLLGKKEGGAIKGYAKGGKIEGYAYGGDIEGLTDQQLKDAALGNSDVISPEDAKQELSRRAKLRTAVQGVRAEEELSSGVASLPADNMAFAADGGIMGYADGGDVARFSNGKDVELGEETYADRLARIVKGQFFPGTNLTEEEKAAVRKGFSNPLNVAEGKSYMTTPVAQLNAKPAASAPAAPAAKKDEVPAAAPAGPARPPKATPGSPAAANVANNLATQQDDYADLKKILQANQERNAKLNEALGADFAEAKKNVEGMRGDIKGIAALRAAAALSQGGPGGTIAQFGRGLGAAGEEAARGINQIQAARQGLLGQQLQMAQLQRQADSGDVTAQLALRELQQKGPLYAAQATQALANAAFLGRRDGGGGSSSLASTRLYAQQLDKAIKDFGIPTSAGDKLRLEELKRERDALRSLLAPNLTGGGGQGLPTLPKGAVVAN